MSRIYYVYLSLAADSDLYAQDNADDFRRLFVLCVDRPSPYLCDKGMLDSFDAAILEHAPQPSAYTITILSVDTLPSLQPVYPTQHLSVGASTKEKLLHLHVLIHGS